MIEEIKMVGNRVLVSIEDRQIIGKGGIIFNTVSDDLIKGKVIKSGCPLIKHGDSVFFKKFGMTKFADSSGKYLYIVEEKDIVMKLSHSK